jgi:signal transduction histidine kinase
MDEPAVAAPVEFRDAVIGWAVMVGPTLAHDRNAEELITLVARCASVFVGLPRREESIDRVRRRWEDAARDGYWEWDLASGAMRFSRQALSLLNHRERDRPGRAAVWLDRVHPDDRAALITTLLTAASDDSVPVELDHRIVRSDGTVGWLAVRALLERDGSGRPIRLIGWLSDVSRARHVEAELRKTQALADVGRVAAGTAHDFNNFLTVIRGHTELAMSSVDAASAAQESLELIKHAAAGATALTRQLISLRRRQATMQPLVDLNAVVAASERTLRSLAGSATQVTLTLAPELPEIRVEPGQVERLLINLVVNARDAMPRGGEVTIETADASYDALGGTARPLLLPVGEYVMLTVSDTGAGMSEETRSRIFDPFFTTKPAGRGTGLGLWIARDIMQRCGGGIDVSSSPGGGTTFRLYFPRAEPLA